MNITSINSSYFNMGMPGQCYMAAAGVAFTLQDTGLRPVICHGVGTCCPTGEAPGSRMMHAWVEIKVPITRLDNLIVNRVVDAARVGKPIACRRRQDYYRLGEVEHSKVRRYQPEQAWQLMATLDHFGPWHAPLDTADDWTERDQEMIDCDGLYRCDDESEASLFDLREYLPWLDSLFQSMYQTGTK